MNALPSFGPAFLNDLRIGMSITDPNAVAKVPEFDIVIKMPHVPMQTAQMVAERAGLRPKQRRIISSVEGVRGLPPGKLHIIEVRRAPLEFYRGHYLRDDDMWRALEPYRHDDRYEVIWHDCDTTLGVKR